MVKQLRLELADSTSDAKRKKISKRLKVLEAFKGSSNKPEWMLFDLRSDPGEQRDIAAENQQIVGEMRGAYEEWWQAVVPMMVNEKAPLSAENPFWTLYKKQFGSLRPPADAATGNRRSRDDQ